MPVLLKRLTACWLFIRSIGVHPQMDDYEKRKLSVFNQLNSIGLLCGTLIPIIGLLDNQELPLIATCIAFAPALISSFVLFLNHKQQHEKARMLYFMLYPFVTSLVYAAGLEVGIQLFFVLYGILGIFYMQKPVNGLLVFSLSMSCYLVLYLFDFSYSYQLRYASFPFYIFNHVVAVISIFFALTWIKKENTGYQRSILEKNESLYQTNQKVEKQNAVIALKAEQLSELNSIKNKLFSVISHDLKTPIYALRNLFRNAEKFDLSGDELKVFVPDIVNDLNSTTALMDNLLQWAKSQMQANSVQLQPVDLSQTLSELTQLLRLQAQSKNVTLEVETPTAIYGHADKEMLHLVLRNLLSNAIKFTSSGGCVMIDVTDMEEYIEIAVTDTGIGMSGEAMHKLSENNFYTTSGTSNETGTGLGLMLCKDFLHKMGSRLFIESTLGEGSTFSFTLPREQGDCYVGDEKDSVVLQQQ